MILYKDDYNVLSVLAAHTEHLYNEFEFTTLTETMLSPDETVIKFLKESMVKIKEIENTIYAFQENIEVVD